MDKELHVYYLQTRMNFKSQLSYFRQRNDNAAWYIAWHRIRRFGKMLIMNKNKFKHFKVALDTFPATNQTFQILPLDSISHTRTHTGNK